MKLKTNELEKQIQINQDKIKVTEVDLSKEELIKSYSVIMNSGDIPAKVLSTMVEEKRKEIVVYVKDLPLNDGLLNKLIIIRSMNQTFRDYPDSLSISIWDDEGMALKYIKGDYDKEASYTGWEGFDHRKARIDKDDKGIHISYGLSRDDFEQVSFGLEKWTN
ncbi:hypothetical protein [Paenibacillus roseipurpureus]|uniref:Uncharacterized protein n=1 Tax=Paenibacillus roseopurpureus TaxID=2918901 RepID=A0AA96LNK3_9BACL|nr:hypothetical protein [Paenibacillus sp. MBLB1832]WNR44412.1 hypothetical protein MJB10_25675 [Paenibacillus sp. MBLB1832]